MIGLITKKLPQKKLQPKRFWMKHPIEMLLLMDKFQFTSSRGLKPLVELPSRERSHIPPWEKENNLQKCLGMGYVSSQGIKMGYLPYQSISAIYSSLYSCISTTTFAIFILMIQRNPANTPVDHEKISDKLLWFDKLV